MSRSFKKSPVYKGNSSAKSGKNLAARKIRRTADVPANKSNFFRKVFCSWEIHDYRFYEPKPDDAESENWKKRWQKYYYRK